MKTVGHQKYQKMFEPASLGALKVKNRLVMAPMGTRLASEIGGVTQRQIDHYAERAKGGVGTVIVEVTCVDHPLGVTGPTTLTLHDNSYIGGHNELVEGVHEHGARIICQLVHAGKETRPTSIKGMQPVAPSPIPCKFLGVTPRALKLEEIEEIVQKFIAAAVRVKVAGYDGVELHGAHGYLIAQFMSEASNQRKDRYGGSLERRMAFPLEIIRGIRKQLGRDFPLLFRLSAVEFVERGREIEESKEVAKILEGAGVDALDVTVGTYDSMPTMIEPMSYPEAWKIHLAESIKKVVHIPVIGVGVIRKPKTAEEILATGRVDFIALARALLADPYWPQKAKEGRDDDITPCISCNVGCIGGRIFRDLHIRCTVNPFTGRERLRAALAPASEKKKVLVAGGGPAGMMAALTARRRGHEVTLYEKGTQLGGQLHLAGIPPGKEKIGWFLDYLKTQVKKEKIDVRLESTVSPDRVVNEKPDAVVIATGGSPLIPQITGLKKKSVFTAWDVLAGRKEVRDREVIVAGGGTVGCEVALYLAPLNRRITIIEMLNGLALDMEPINRMDLMSKIKESGIAVLLGKRLVGLEADGVRVLGPDDHPEVIRAERVVLAMGTVSENALVRKLEGVIDELYVVGDSDRPRKIIDSVYEGLMAGLRI